MTQSAPHRAKRNLTGPITIGVMFLLGLAVFAGFWRATRSSNPAPATATFTLPSRSIRVVSFDVKGAQRDRALDAIDSMKPDIVLLQNVPTSDVGRIGEALHMSRADQPDGDVFYPSQNFDGPATPFGNAIYSRFPLYEGRSIPSRGGSFGVWAVVVIDDAKVMVASVRTTDSSSSVLGTQEPKEVRANELSTLVRAHDELGAPPIILGGVFAGLDAQETWTFTHFGPTIAQRDDQRLFAFAAMGSSWLIVPVSAPNDAVPGVCAEVSRR